MATKVIMPKQGLQMTEGTIISWLAAEGDTVKEGDPIFEMETDKLTIEIGAPAAGTLLKIVRGEGDVVPITETIAFIGEAGEDISDLLAELESSSESDETGETEPAEAIAESGAGGPSGPVAESSAPAATTEQAAGGSRATSDGPFYSSPRARWKAEERGLDVQALAGSGPEGMVIERDVLAAAENRPKATPLARIHAAESGTDLSSVEGTGPRGKIYRRDVDAAAAGTAAAGGAEGGRMFAAIPREDRSIPLTGMRRTISARMRESLDTAAQAVHRIEVDMSETVRMRERLKAAEVKVSYNDIILKAVAESLRTHPRMNSVLTEDAIIEHGRINIGVAVALDEGLIVPVLRDADLLTLQGIHSETRRLAELARTGGLSQEDYQGGTFSVSNLGMYDLDSFTAIINRPESGILAVGAIKEKPAAVDGELVIRPLCGLSLTYDHRIIDGAPAADFLRSIKTLLENPYLLL